LSVDANLKRSHALTARPPQAKLIAVVAGSEIDAQFWVNSLRETGADVISSLALPQLIPITEYAPAGNFFGTVRAWNGIRGALQTEAASIEGVSVVCMVFGQGTRLSPFTQALRGRKSALRTPFESRRSGCFLRTIDLALLYSNIWLETLTAKGFNGVLVKWGDEATVPSIDWLSEPNRLEDMDMVRFVWRTEPTETYAREKEWFVLDQETKTVVGLLPRQPLADLKLLLEPFSGNRYCTAVNVGSVAVSYPLLEAARSSLGSLLDGKTADWDPFVSYLLLGGDAESSNPYIMAGLSAMESRAPGITRALLQLRGNWPEKHGRNLKSGYLEFGDALWIDLGLHETLRRSLEGMTEESARGRSLRLFFGLPEELDPKGNILLNSSISPGLDVRNSILLNTKIEQFGTKLFRAVVVDSEFGFLHLPDGGCALFSSGARLEAEGPRTIAYGWRGGSALLKEGERLTSIRYEGRSLDLRSFEDWKDYGSKAMATPTFGNEISFAEAGRVMTMCEE